MTKEKCQLCNPEKQRCSDCVEVPDEFSEYIDYPVLNPVQTEAYENLDKECFICTSSTGTGKTLIFEMKMIRWLEDKNEEDMAFVLEPLKMLANEKVKEWNERYPDLDIIELTGDTKDDIIEKSNRGGSKNEKLAHEISKHDIVVTSYEMFSSLTLKNSVDILSNMTLFGVDEIHMLADESRGQELEGALIRYFRNYNNPRCEFLGLSATFENNEDLEEFFANFGYNAKTIQSEWSPVKRELDDIHPYRKFSERDSLMADLTYDLLQEYDKVLTVVFSRSGTESIAWELNSKSGRQIAEFHHAGVEKRQRKERERKFKENDGTEVLVATPTVASGVNLPADGIVLNADYFDGLTKENKVLQKMTIDQIVGRAGRPQFCDEAKIEFTIQSRLENQLKRELNGNLNVEGTLYDNIDLVLLEELRKRKGAEIDEIEEWLDLSFSEITNPEHRDVEKDIEELIERGFIEMKDRKLRNTNKGRACATTMLDPRKFDLILSILSEIDEDERTTRDMISVVDAFYNADITAKIENPASRFRDYINYSWMMDGGYFKWTKSAPQYDFQREVREEFNRIEFALDVQGHCPEIISAIAEMKPLKFYRLKKELNDMGIKKVGQKRLLVLWFNGLKADDLSEPPQRLSLPKTLDNIITITPIDEADREVVSDTRENINKIYPEKKWMKDRQLISEMERIENGDKKSESDEEQMDIDDFFEV